MTGSAGSICALGLLLGRVPFFNDGVTSWHVFNWSAGGKKHQRHVNWTRQTDFSILTTAHLFCRKVCGVIDVAWERDGSVVINREKRAEQELSDTFRTCPLVINLPAGQTRSSQTDTPEIFTYLSEDGKREVEGGGMAESLS